ncbi:MAG: M23 family metallopeptidase [Lachnospiraceae bacterium]|nr:M23 family metallopeptidase [Lachnospiraceae bacterium]
MRFTKYRKTLKFTYLKWNFMILLLCLFFIPSFVKFESTGDNLFHIFVNGIEVGSVDKLEEAEDMLWDARREIAAASEELVLMDVNMTYVGEEMLYGYVDDPQEVYSRIRKVLRDSIQETDIRSYTLKMDEYMVSLASVEEMRQLLQAVISKYDSENEFGVEIVQEEGRLLNVLTAQVVDRKSQQEAQEQEQLFPEAGIQSQLTELFAQEVEPEEKDFEDYDLGIMSMQFTEEVEIVEAYLPQNQLMPLEQAIEEVTKEQETVGTYTVVSGDTLSEISIKVNIPMETLVAMNDSLDDINSTIRVDQELIITVPEPEVSVERQEVNYYEEIYDAEVIYIDRDDWYTTQTNVVQQPSAGFRKIVAEETYVDDTLVEREILKEEVLMEAVAKIVERGTKVPPTYIKPISGGRASSGFGRRKAPTKGASTYHKGQDWATPVGTTVVASCGGRVSKAGWGSGYGYVVYIDHEDGRQTRYAHLSEILVSVGDYVKQGQRIALSGNTGVSTGPHLHFEILINGVQVNPLKYLQ